MNVPRRGVLFDLDGTLADTAPDLGYALNQQRLARGMPELPIEAVRSQASSGARGLLKIGFGIEPGQSGYEALRDEFLDIYEENLARSSRLFATSFENSATRWGDVFRATGAVALRRTEKRDESEGGGRSADS